MSLFNWFKKEKNELYVEEVPNFNMVPDYYTREEVDSIKAEISEDIQESLSLLKSLQAKQDQDIASLRSAIDSLKESFKGEYITTDQLNFVVESLSKVLHEKIEDIANTSPVIVDPAPVSPPLGWRHAIQDEIVMKTELAKADVKSYVDDCLKAYDVEEDIEIEERLSQLTPLSAEEIDALYMDEAETTTVAQKTLNGFRAEVYNKALSDLKLVPTSKATVAAVRAFLVKFVESLKPV